MAQRLKLYFLRPRYYQEPYALYRLNILTICADLVGLLKQRQRQGLRQVVNSVVMILTRSWAYSTTSRSSSRGEYGRRDPQPFTLKGRRKNYVKRTGINGLGLMF